MENRIPEMTVIQGPLLADMLASSSISAKDYSDKGGYETLKKLINNDNFDEAISELEEARLRGRAGGGYPTAHKWWLTAKSESPEKVFICNANSGSPGSFKERFLLRSNPHQIVEAVACGAAAIGAETAFIALPPDMGFEFDLLEKAVTEAEENNFLGEGIFQSGKSLRVIIYKTLNKYIVGEETALLELIEGKPARPRGKPPLPTAKGLFDQPTVINNLETVLHAHYIFKYGADSFRRHGTLSSPGTLIFSLSGQVNRPGLFELPLGTSLRELIYEYGGGIKDDQDFKAAFVGGIGSAIATEEMLDIKLDYDSLYDANLSLGSGVVISLGQKVDMSKVALRTADFLNAGSCGKCLPCKDGTHRTKVMLSHLEKIGEKSIDRIDKIMPPTLRKRTLNVINPVGGVSYTDTVTGVEKIVHLCEFYKYRGDCHHSYESATAIQSLINNFRSEFESSLLDKTVDRPAEVV